MAHLENILPEYDYDDDDDDDDLYTMRTVGIILLSSSFSSSRVSYDWI